MNETNGVSIGMRMSTAGGLEEDKSCKNLDLNNGYNNLDSNTNCDSLDSRNGDKSVDANKKLRDQDSNCDSVLPEYGSRLADFLEKKTKVALLLDFDGTLSPLVSRPEDAILPDHTKKLLQRLASKPKVFLAIISGRQVNNVRDKVRMDEITYAGSHGLDIIFSDSSKYEHPISEDTLAKSRSLLTQIKEQCERDGAMVEDKGAVFTFHYRNVPLEKQAELISQVESLIQAVGFRAGRAHAAIESKPPLHWDKGKACNLIMDKMFGKDWRDSVGPIFVGDDVTDEDAMLALQGHGLSFKVTGSTESLADHVTHADVKLATVQDVTQLLAWIDRLL